MAPITALSNTRSIRIQVCSCYIETSIRQSIDKGQKVICRDKLQTAKKNQKLVIDKGESTKRKTHPIGFFIHHTCYKQPSFFESF